MPQIPYRAVAADTEPAPRTKTITRRNSRLLHERGEAVGFKPIYLHPPDQFSQIARGMRLEQIRIRAEIVGAIDICRVIGGSEDGNQKPFQAGFLSQPRQNVETV